MVTCQISNFFIFCLNNTFSELFSKIVSKDLEALNFFSNRGKFQKHHFSAEKLPEIK